MSWPPAGLILVHCGCMRVAVVGARGFVAPAPPLALVDAGHYVAAAPSCAGDPWLRDQRSMWPTCWR